MIRRRLTIQCDLADDTIKFGVRMPSTLDMMQAIEAMDTDRQSQQLAAMLDLLVSCVDTVSGLTDEDGPIDWPDKPSARRELLAQMPAAIIAGIGNEVIKARGTGADLGKLRITAG